MDELEYMNTELPEQSKPNVLMGILGAFVGALLGGAIWVGINQFGIIAFIAGYAIIYFACQGYGMLAKGIDLKGVIIATVISILVLSAAHFLCWGIDVYKEFSIDYDITFMDALLATPSIVVNSEIIGWFIRDFVIGFALIIAGAVPYFRSAIRSKKREEELL